jgi:hypothetical protein
MDDTKPEAEWLAAVERVGGAVTAHVTSLVRLAEEVPGARQEICDALGITMNQLLGFRSDLEARVHSQRQ